MFDYACTSARGNRIKYSSENNLNIKDYDTDLFYCRTAKFQITFLEHYELDIS